MMVSSVRFLQISDLHLGARVLPRCFAVTSSVRQQREGEILDSLRKLITIAKDDDIEVVLAVGDIFDRDSVSAEVVNEFFEIMAELPPVFIVPGNHDYFSGASPYSNFEREQRGLADIPDNVYVFSGTGYQSAYLSNRSDVVITAQAFTSNMTLTEHALINKIPRDPAQISILMLHGSRTQFAFEETKKITAPFTAAELLAQGFSYTALGHYHSFSTIKNADGMVKAAYSGRPFGCEFTAKEGACLGGIITSEGVDNLIKYDIDSRRIFDIPVYCDNVENTSQLLRLAQEQILKLGVICEDIVRFRFKGTRSNDFKIELPLPAGSYFAVAVDSSDLALGYDLKELLQVANSKAATAESLFARDIYNKLSEAEDESQKHMLFDALDYGMKALRGIRIIPREVDNGDE